jgi:phospholipid/cholesterol/gamma-HCH transport system substrate-binding protein
VKQRVIDFMVGVFLVIAMLGLLFLAFRVSDLSMENKAQFYTVTAEFDNIGGLKVRAPVAISGVRIGEVTEINLDKNNYRAKVTLRINRQYDNLPIDSSANIFTQGILGSNYISLVPGFDEQNLQNGSRIETTHSALVLENLIGQLVYSLKSDSQKPVSQPVNQSANQPVN